MVNEKLLMTHLVQLKGENNVTYTLQISTDSQWETDWIKNTWVHNHINILLESISLWNIEDQKKFI